MVFDLHVHSLYSDGDLSPADIIGECHRRGISGLALTDHNGIWGEGEAREEAGKQGLKIISGIEVTAVHEGQDVHILGYARTWKKAVLQEGLAETRKGYQRRAEEMIRKCQEYGYDKISFAAAQERRRGQERPCFMSYDVARELTIQHSVSVQEARRLVVQGGPCHVPYGNWALSTGAAIDLLHRSGGVAVLAHPALGLHNTTYTDVIAALLREGLDGIEVYHPYHGEALITALRTLTEGNQLLVTGGSDWHGPGRYAKSDEVFGRVGIGEEDFQKVLSALS